MIGRWPFTITPLGAPTQAVGYAIDPLSEEFTGPSSVALMRAQADTSGKPNEGSLNREDFWRRTVSSWHLGAGQRVYDDEESNPSRFFESSGIDPWTKNQISLLPAVEAMTGWADGFTPRRLLSASDSSGDYLYFVDNSDTIYKYFSTNFGPPSSPSDAGDFTPLTGAGVEHWFDLVTDGAHVFAASEDGIFQFFTDDAGVGGVWNTLVVERLWYARNRLLATSGADLFNILTSAPPTAIYTHPNPNWAWTGVAEADSYIYVAGHAGRTSAIYKMTVGDDEAVSLDAPVIAVQLPDGETVLSIYGYAGFILIGTTLGVRLAQPSGDGFLTYGGLLEIGGVTAMEGERDFVWCATYDSDSAVAHTKLWRLSLKNDSFIAALTPAYATDLESPLTQSKLFWYPVYVSSIATFKGKRFFVQTSGIETGGIAEDPFGAFFMETTNLVTEGFVNMGITTFGMTEPKRLHEVVVNHRQLPGVSAPTSDQLSFLVAFDSTDDSLFDLDKTLVVDSTSTIFHPTTDDGEPFDIRWNDITPEIRLRRENADKTISPVVRSFTIKARPTPDRANMFIVPVIISDEINDLSRAMHKRDATGMLATLMGYADTGIRLDMTLLGYGFQGYVEDYQFGPEQMSRYDDHFIGTLLLRIREVG